MVLALRSSLALQTRCENQIANEINREPVRFGDTVLVRDFERQYRNGLHRPINPSRKYNCHGLSFASRRTWIEEDTEIKKIIKDDDYQVVPFAGVLPGDIAVYYAENGDAEHSGIVVRVDEMRVPIILSKWGFCQEVIHHVAQCPYDAKNVLYYRITT
jgi:hypothetical protein